MKQRKIYAPIRTKAKSFDRVAVLISINEDKYVEEWKDGLLDGKNDTYDTIRIKDAYKGMPVFFHYYHEGIRWKGIIIDPKGGFPVIGNVTKTKRLIDIEEMRKTRIINNNPPRLTQYLSASRLEILNKLTK